MIRKLEVICAIISLICGIGLIVFSCVDMPGKELALFIFGIILIAMALIYMYLYDLNRRKRNFRK